MSERAFVAGATGHTGRAVIRHLLSRGADAIAHVRPDSSRLAHWEAHFGEAGAQVDRTPWDEEAMRATLAELAPTVVFALLGTTKERARALRKQGSDAAGETYEAVDYGLTALLRRAAEGCGHSPRFVYLSSLGVKESTSNRYLAARARIERELREGNLPYTIVRPAFITGDREEARFGESLGAALTDGALGLIGALGASRTRDKYRSITGDELGAALVRAAFDLDALGKVLEPDELRSDVLRS